MLLDFVHIRNYRRLQDCTITFSEKETIFVGANNSGKTSAMNAIIGFLKPICDITLNEVTVTNWPIIEGMGSFGFQKIGQGKTPLKWKTGIP